MQNKDGKHRVFGNSYQISKACRGDLVDGNPCPETYLFRAAGKSSKYTFKSTASAGDKVIVI